MCSKHRDSRQVNGDFWGRLPSQQRQQVIAQSWRRFHVEPAQQVHQATLVVALNGPGAIEECTQVATQKRIEGKALSLLDRARAVMPLLNVQHFAEDEA